MDANEIQARDRFASAMNGVRESEGNQPYTAEEIAACWNDMLPAEKAEWHASPSDQMTFESFQSTRRFVERLGEEIAAGWGAEAGYLYAGDFWIAAGPDDNIRTVYLVVTPTAETTFDTLEAAERHLWEWVQAEFYGDC